jgi:cytochrome P450
MSTGDENAIITAIHLVEDDLAEEIFRAFPHTPWSYVRKKRKLKRARDIMSVVVERMRKNAKTQSLLRAFEELGLEGVDLRDEVLLMLLAGHHTTGTAATWLLYHIATQPELADKLALEAAALSNDSGELTAHAVQRAHVSKRFVQEILRLYPSTYWMSRETKRPLELAGIRLKAGTSLILSPWHLHRDPKYWQRPNEFDCDRDYTCKAYMPFGYGARACVGMMVSTIELQVMALEFAAAFAIGVVSKVPPDPPRPSVTLVPSDVRLIFHPRKAGTKKHDAALINAR